VGLVVGAGAARKFERVWQFQESQRERERKQWLASQAAKEESEREEPTPGKDLLVMAIVVGFSAYVVSRLLLFLVEYVLNF